MRAVRVHCLLERRLLSFVLRLLAAFRSRRVGAEFAAAAQSVVACMLYDLNCLAASKYGANVMLIDRSVQITLKRVWSALSMWEKCYLVWALLTEVGDSLIYK